MLKDARVGAMIPTTDLARAKEFYEGKLGLTPEDDPGGGALYRCADGTGFVVFPSSGKSSGTHTQLGFDVQDLEAEASSLAAQGITPEPVEIPGITIENGIAEMHRRARVVDQRPGRQPDRGVPARRSTGSNRELSAAPGCPG